MGLLSGKLRKTHQPIDLRKKIVSAVTRASQIFLVAAVIGSCVSTAHSQDDAGRVWVLPFEVDFDSGAANGDAIIGRLIPVNSLIVREDWKLVNVAMVTIADAPGGRPGQPGNPEPVPGPNVFGLGDLTDAVLYTRTTPKGLMWGVGAAVGIPTATDDLLGSGKWQAGPALRLGYQAGAWQFGLLATNRWSFAGDSDRANTNQLLMRGLIRRTLGTKWFFISGPIITANWNAASGQKWLVPLGGGIGRSFDFTPPHMNVSLQVYANVIKPDGAPDWVARVEVTFPFRLPKTPGR
jgi:hypothetical protein